MTTYLTRAGDAVVDSPGAWWNLPNADCPSCGSSLQAGPPRYMPASKFGAQGSWEMPHGAVVIPMICGAPFGPDPEVETAEMWWTDQNRKKYCHFFMFVIVPHKGGTTWGLVRMAPEKLRVFLGEP